MIMEIRIIDQSISQAELEKLAEETFGDMIKGVVDVEKGVMALGGELHEDAEALLLENGSNQQSLWGINILPQKPKEDRIEFTSLINIRPSRGYRSMEIEDEEIKEKIKNIIDGLID